MSRRAAVDKEVEAYCAGVRAGDRRILAKTITLFESVRDDHVELGQRVLEAIVPESGGALRLGISGTPGVGKSTLIEVFGLFLIEAGHRVAVLAVDPSSPRTGGSILGDKTRLERLSRCEEAFIRPSPSRGSLGGVAQRTRESVLVCEAAGFDVVIVETVGVGQSEATVASMVDFFVVLLQPGAGDELQGMKKGVLELADALVVNKADGDQRDAAVRAQAEYRQALELFRPVHPDWTPPVLLTSAVTQEGVPEIWESALAHRRALEATGAFAERRRRQSRAWLWSMVEDGLGRRFRSHPAVKERIPELEREVADQRTTASAAARLLLEAFRNSR
jgi:LAO/AO transport system kinase